LSSSNSGNQDRAALEILFHEASIGVRMAVGAPARSIEWMILKESLALLVVGFVIGIPEAIIVARLVTTMLFGLTPQDPVTIAATLANSDRSCCRGSIFSGAARRQPRSDS
jgi:ABC-type antimicrobial peptide transport system permease subunit